MKNNIIIILLFALILIQGVTAYLNYESRDIGRYQMIDQSTIIDTKFGWTKNYASDLVTNRNFHENEVWFERAKLLKN